jgi:hypothetical protein
MTDKFMSGWGAAKGKTNKLVIVCETREQAMRIERNAHDRSEMKNVSVRTTEPRYGAGYVTSWKDYADMGGNWLND